MLIETHPIIPLLCDWPMFSLVDPPLAAGKMAMRKNYFFTGGIQNGFTELQAASYMHFHCQNRFRVFEEGY
jgi:hypothetical protein